MSKRKRLTGLVLSLIVVVLAALLGLDSSDTESLLGSFDEIEPGYYPVLEINDGDTITIDMNGRSEQVRFIGVDTPETHHPSRPVQCFGHAATDFLTQLIGDEPVRLEADPTNSNRDRYDRLLRYAYLPDGTLLNAEMVKQGYGFAYVAFPFEKSAEFENYETEAREQNRGLWSACEVELDNGYLNTNPASS